MEAATTRNIRIGKASIGLIGLDRALNQAMARAMGDEEAVDFLFQAIKEENYVPTAAKDDYRRALLAEYRRLSGRDEGHAGGLVVRIFGSGCVSCNGLHTLLIEVLGRMNIPADIEQIHDPDEIGRHGIVLTPALMINGRVKSGGLLPTPAQVEQWIREALDAL